MTNKEIENKIEELSIQIEALKEELKETPKREIWEPKKGDTYWYIDYAGKVFSGECFGNLELVSGNMYPTEEKAQFEANREKYTRLFRQYVEQHSEPLDWSDDNQAKWCVDYDHSRGKICFDNIEEWQGMEVYGSSKEVMQEAVDFVGEENMIKYVLGVKSE